MREKKIDLAKLEGKWQKSWESKKIFEVKESVKGKKKYYVLEMFPYPSGSGLHMGHAFNYTIGDIQARYMRMKGYNVLYPMGYDSFGLPAENAAIKAGEHPKRFTEKSIKNFIKQQKSLGLSYDWNRMIMTHSPDYYKWNQYFFLKFLEKGLIYRKKSPVNFCEKCDTVLANEQVHNGKCWRHPDTDVKIKHLEQWFIKTTDYADELLDKVDGLDWPQRIKSMQKNWIGKSYGTEVEFEVEGLSGKKSWPIFTTRADTIYGVTFMVVSAQHSNLMDLVVNKKKKEVEKFLKRIKSVSEKSKSDSGNELDKEGVFTGSYAINPLTKDKVPIYAGNFVVADYGSGMVMAVPAHDQRDYEFAVKYNLPIKKVIEPLDREFNLKDEGRAFVGEGRLINSEKFNGMENKKAIDEIQKYLEKLKLGRKKIQFKLKDWLVSRQRYWGTPIPIIYCEHCGIVAVPEKDLPVKLPDKVKFGKGNPLATSKTFMNVKCPKCHDNAKRETDTMDTFFDSSWYYLRYCDSDNSKFPFDGKKEDYWMGETGVDTYIGGAEHATMHLIYARFFYKALRDLGIIQDENDEPFKKLFNQGMLHGKDGVVMSKSRGNVVLPEEVSKIYGIDTARLFLMSIASPDKDTQWDDKGIEGSLKFVNKVFEFFRKNKFGKSSKIIGSKINKGIQEISEDIENFKYNLAVIKIRQLFDKISEDEKLLSKNDAESFLKLFSVFCPHISEEIWHNFGNKSFISIEKWPICDDKKIDEKLEKQEEQIDKIVYDIMNILRILRRRVEKPG